MKLNQQRMFTQFFIYPLGKSVFSDARKKKRCREWNNKKRNQAVWERTIANWQLMRIVSAEIATLKNLQKKDININLYAHFFVNSAGKLKLDAFIRFFSVQYLSFVSSFRLKSLTFSKFLRHETRFLSSSFLLARPSLFATSCVAEKKAFQKHKYWKVGEFIDISEFVLFWFICDLISSPRAAYICFL